MDTPTDEQVRSYIDSVAGLRREWGIPKAKRASTIAFVLMNICLIAVIVGAIAYFMFGNPNVVDKGLDGLIIVLALAYVVSGIRIFQLRAERAELPGFRKMLAQHLTGNPQTDPEVQTRVEAEYRWTSIRYQRIARMIGLAGLIIIAINTYQVGVNDYGRVLLFDGAILIYLTGAFWNSFALKTDLLEVELEERSRATIKWQTEHPGEAQAETAQDDVPAEPIVRGAHSKDDSRSED